MSIIPLLLSYASMAVVQSKGADIIAALWGDDAKQAALAQNVDNVQPDANVQILCGGYATAHFDVTSNILHAAGMLAALYLAVTVLVAVPLGLRRSTTTTLVTVVQLFLWIWPIYYLPAWVGHLWLQKDIPAVFTYGTTLRGWAAGEYCAFVDLFSGGVVSQPVPEIVPTAILTLIFIQGIEFMSLSSSSSKAVGKKKVT